MPARRSGSPSQPGPPAFADQLNRVITVMRPGGVKQTDEMIAAAVGVTSQYIGQLRNGRKANPSLDLTGRLAGFFGVDVAFFLDPDRAAAMDKELEMLAAMRDLRVKRLALRMSGLSPQGLDWAADFVERLRRMEGLADDPDGLATEESM
jgi:transcriptional regulator with XRE-family HTH domain